MDDRSFIENWFGDALFHERQPMRGRPQGNAEDFMLPPADGQREVTHPVGDLLACWLH